MTNQQERWPAVATAIAARMDELHLTKAELSRRSGISDTTIAAYLGGSPIKRRDKRWALCEALGWVPESIELIREGAEAVTQDDDNDARSLHFAPADAETVFARIDALEEAIAELRQVMAEIRSAVEDLEGSPQVDGTST